MQTRAQTRAGTSSSGPQEPKTKQKQKRRRRFPLPALSGTSDESSNIDESDDYDETAEAKRYRRRTVALRASPERPAAQKRKAPSGGQCQPLAKKPKKTEPVEASFLQGSGVIPQWTILPYEVLVQVFQYAAYPLVDERFEPSPSIEWLLNAALVCKAFLEPALAALYYAPPLSPPSRASGLFRLLATQDERSVLNYRNKIKFLDMETISTLIHKYSGQSPLELNELVAMTPQLKGLGIHLVTDVPRLKKLSNMGHSRRPGPVYQKALFDNLGRHKISLLQWKWNLQYNTSSGSDSDLFSWKALKDYHSLPAFRGLRTLDVVDFEASGQISEDSLADAISALPDLKHLSFVLSTFSSDGEWLLKLPRNLGTLAFSDCKGLTSEKLQAFLLTHGSNLRTLFLKHNRMLDLGFLVDLAESCPKLEVFEVDLMYYSRLLTTSATNPEFEKLLTVGDKPTWPSSLRSIELSHLRKWDSQAADMFFASIVDSAAALPDLRELAISASVATGWKERVTFRKKWIGRLRKVFLRKSPDPNPHMRSIPGARDYLARAVLRSKQVEVPARTPDPQSDSDVPTVPRRRSGRLRGQDEDLSQCQPSRRAMSRRPADSDQQTGERDEKTRLQEEQEPFIQGMCSTVDVRIDNLRPTEVQLNEGDFLDEEKEGDEDWNGRDEMADGW